MSTESLAALAEEFEEALLGYHKISSKVDGMEGMLKAVCSLSNQTRDQSLVIQKENESLALRISKLEVRLHNFMEKIES